MSVTPKVLPADFQGFDEEKAKTLPKTLPADFGGFDRPSPTAPMLKPLDAEFEGMLNRTLGTPLVPAHVPQTPEQVAATLPKTLPVEFTQFDKPAATPSPVPSPSGKVSEVPFRIGMGAELPTLEPAAKQLNEPLLPIGRFTREQVSKIPDDATKWKLYTLLDAGQLSADVVEGLSTPENIALIGALATVPEAGAARWVKKLVSLGFSASMAEQSATKIVSGFAKAKRGELRAAGQDFGSSVVNAAFSVAAGLGVKGRTPGLGPKPKTTEAEAPVEAPATERAPVETVPTPKTELPGRVVAIDEDSGLPIVRRETTPATAPEVPETPAPVIERRLDRQTRMEVDDWMRQSGETDREAALQDVLEARRLREGPAVKPPAPPVRPVEEPGPEVPPEVERPAETAPTSVAPRLVPEVPTPKAGVTPTPTVMFGKEATYSGVKEIEARLGEEVSAPRLVVRQEGKGAKTWLVVQRYYGEKSLASGKTYTGQYEDVLAGGLSKAEAKSHAGELLSRVSNVEAGGKLTFEAPARPVPAEAPTVPQLPFAAQERVSKRTGFTPSQQKFLAGRLEAVAPALPPRQGARSPALNSFLESLEPDQERPFAEKWLSQGSTSKPELAEYELGSPRGRQILGQLQKLSETEAPTIRVPGDGEFTIPSQEAASRLHKQVTGEPIEGVPAPRISKTSERVRPKTWEEAVQSEADRTLQLYGSADEAASALREQLEAIRQDPELEKTFNTGQLESVIGELEARAQRGVRGEAALTERGTRALTELKPPEVTEAQRGLLTSGDVANLVQIYKAEGPKYHVSQEYAKKLSALGVVRTGVKYRDTLAVELTDKGKKIVEDYLGAQGKEQAPQLVPAPPTTGETLGARVRHPLPGGSLIERMAAQFGATTQLPSPRSETATAGLYLYVFPDGRIVDVRAPKNPRETFAHGDAVTEILSPSEGRLLESGRYKDDPIGYFVDRTGSVRVGRTANYMYATLSGTHPPTATQITVLENILRRMVSEQPRKQPKVVIEAQGPTGTRVHETFQGVTPESLRSALKSVWQRAQSPEVPGLVPTVPEVKGPWAGGYGAKARPDLPSVEEVSATPELVSRADVLRTLSEQLERPFSVGRFREKALGIYKVIPEGIRLRKANDIMVALHEAGHHVNKLLWGTYSKPVRGLSLDWEPLKPYRSELNPKNGFGYTPPGGSYLPESFADFVAEYVARPGEAQRRAPKFYQFFEKELEREPELKALITDVRGKLRDYVAQSPKQKILSQISQQDSTGVRFSTDKLYTWAIDALRPVQQVVESMKKVSGEPTENAYTLGRLLAGWWGKAQHFLDKGTFDPNTLQVTGKSLRGILQPWDGKLDDLRVYLVAQRALELGRRGKGVGIDLGDAKVSVAELEKQYPNIAQTAEEIYQFEDATLQYLRDSGYLGAEEYAKIKALNEAHVPLYRIFEESPFAGGPSLGGKKLADLWNPVKRLKGSGRQIVDPLESIIKNVYTFINLAERNRVALAITRQAARTEGSARWLEEVTPPNARPVSFTLEEIKKALEDAGADLTDADLQAVASVFRPSFTTAANQAILTVRDGGKVSYWQVHDKDLFRALEAMDQESSNFLIRILSLPARLLRLGATSMGPEFVIRNPLRDAMDAFMQSRNGFIPGVDSVRGLFHAIGRDELYWEWKRAGGDHAALVSMDRATLRQHLNDLMASKTKWVVRHPIEALRLLSETGEAATRLGEYGKARARGKTPQQAALESREVTIDFARMGARTRALNSLVAFFNAAVQGTNKFIRVHRENPKGTLVKGLVGLTIPSLLLWWANREDEKYQELPQWEKDFFWLIPTKGTRLEKATPFIHIPKPFLWGMVYSTTFERIADWINSKDPHAFDGFAANVAQSALPGMVPTAMIPLVESWANKSMFRGTPIEPRGMEKVAPEQRYTSYTSEFSKQTAGALAKAGIHVSPMKLDNAIFGYSGGLGRAITEGLNVPLRSVSGGPSRPSRTMADIPVVRAFAVRWPTTSAKSIQQMYDRLEELEQKQGTAQLNRKYPGRAQGAPLLTPAEMGELRRLRATARNLSEFNRRMRQIESSPAYTPREKRTMIDALVEQEIQTARRVRGFAGR